MYCDFIYQVHPDFTSAEDASHASPRSLVTPHGPFSTLCGFYHGNYARAITAALHEELEVPGWVQDSPLQIIGEGHEIQLPCLNA